MQLSTFILRLRRHLGTSLAWLMLAGLSINSAWAADFMPVSQAFRLSAEATPQHQMSVQITVAPGTYLYRERFSLTSLTPGMTLGEPQLPKGFMKHDPTFDKDMEIYHDLLSAEVGVKAPSVSTGYVKVMYQGCADAGLCYPPQTRYLRVNVANGDQVQAVSEANAEEATQAPVADKASSEATVAPAAAATEGSSNESGRINAALHSGSLITIAGVFLLAGLLLSFTPCVLPMVPILSSIIVGQGGQNNRGKSFAMAVAYSLGMAMVYTAFGVVAGLLGEGLAAALQNPWVLGAFGILLVLLALSMFGAYNLQLPGSWQAGLSQASGRFSAGRLAGVFMMGGLSALIVGPCVAAPLAGALVYISQTRDVVIGGVALFSLAAGMSVPLLLVGLSAGSLLPSTGAWMESVKTFFGMLLLAVALWLVQPVLPAPVTLFLMGMWLALAAAFLGAFDALEAHAGLLKRSLKGMGLVLALIAALQIIGALCGASNPLKPLEPLMGRSVGEAGTGATNTSKLAFQRVGSVDALNAAIKAAQGRPVMLDFYADWCVSCKEMEHLTFSDANVQARLKNVVLLQADVTANNEQDKALMKQFGLFGPPGILFFDGQGQEKAAARVIGYQNPKAFLKSLDAAGV